MFQEHEGRKSLTELDHPRSSRSVPVASQSGDQRFSGATTACSLERILGLLEVLGGEIDQFMRFNARPDDKDDEVALSWMHTAMEDMSATLVGVSADPHHRNEA